MESCCPEVLALLHNWDYCLTRSTKREATFEDRWGDTQVVIMPDHRWKFIRRNVPPEHGEAIEKLDRLMAIHQLSMSEPDGRRERTKRIMKGHLSLMTPSFKGTLKSTRISTRLWARSRSRIDSLGICNKNKLFCCLWEPIAARIHVCARSLRGRGISSFEGSSRRKRNSDRQVLHLHPTRPPEHLYLGMANALPTTLGALRRSEFTPARVGRSVKDELRENLIARLRATSRRRMTRCFPGLSDTRTRWCRSW